MSEKIELLGVKIDNLTMSEALMKIEAFIDKGGAHMVFTPNVDHLVRLQKDEKFRDLYSRADLVLADGMPLLWAARFLKTPLKAKLSGSDLMPQLCQLAADKKWGIYLLGGSPRAAEKAAHNLVKQYPKLKVSGIQCPPVGFDSDVQMCKHLADQIRISKADILFVGLGSPKQERWLDAYLEASGAKVGIGVGIAIDYLAGVVKRAPLWMQKSGLEWLHRLAKEPKRLWRRYLIQDPIFFGLLLRQRFRRIWGKGISWCRSKE